MAKKFSCGDVMAGCGWSATEASEQELFKKIAEHAKKDHNISSIPDDVVQKVKSKIKNV
jgi:predicted small metal-binding protein